MAWENAMGKLGNLGVNFSICVKGMTTPLPFSSIVLMPDNKHVSLL